MNSIKNLFQHITHSWQHHPIIQFTAFLVLSGSYAVIFSMFLFFGNIENILVSWGSDVEMNIYLKDKSNTEDISKIKNSLESLSYFESIRYVDNVDAGEQFLKKCLTMFQILQIKQIFLI